MHAYGTQGKTCKYCQLLKELAMFFYFQQMYNSDNVMSMKPIRKRFRGI